MASGRRTVARLGRAIGARPGGRIGGGPRALLGLGLAAALAMAAAAAPRVERYPEQFGPFALGPTPGERVTVTGVYQRLVDAHEFWRATTLEYWAIQDESHAILARGQESTKTQPPGEYVEAKGLSAYLLLGRGRPMVLLVFGVVPSPPGRGVVYRIFGFDTDGTFREALTLEPHGDGVMNPIDSRTGTIALADGLYLDVSVWVGAFAIRVRYAYDEAGHRFTLRSTCSPPLNPRLDREVMRAAIEQQGQLRVDLFDDPGGRGGRRPLPLTEKSRVTLLEGCAPHLGAAGPPDVWLKVEVDGHTGWVSESEFPKIGLGQGE
jgi:hypothetical protein